MRSTARDDRPQHHQPNCDSHAIDEDPSLAHGRMAMAKRKKPPARPERVRLISPWLVRVIVLAICGVAAATYALARHYTHPRAPMWVPIPPPTELPAPDLIPDTD